MTQRASECGDPVRASRAPSARAWVAPLAWTAAILLGFAASIAAAAGAPRGLRLTDAAGQAVEWWNAESPKARWDGPGMLARAARWRTVRRGVEWAELPVTGAGEASALKLIALRLDPRQLQLSLRWGVDVASGRPAWTLDDAPADAAVALNAGMFVEALPWGWVVSRGAELLPPGRGALSSAVVVTRDGGVSMVDGDDVRDWRAREDVVEAFQTYPTLLTRDGVVPSQLLEGDAIDRTHRDARLAIGIGADGELLIVLTRLDVPVPGLDRLPVGLTVPEMAAVMGSLGARQAALLDGGISAQVRLAGADGVVRDWKGSRAVPLALVARPR